MKKVFFLLSSMNVGGVEKAFLSMIALIPKDRYEIHLGLLSLRGGFLDEVPKHVIIHHIDCYAEHKKIINDPPLKVIKELLIQKYFIKAFIQLLLYIHFKLTHNRYWLYEYILRKEPMFPINFDLAVAYAGPSQSIDYYVCKKIKAKKKCGWIHFDISKFGIDKGMTNVLYKNYDKIFLVSKTAKEHFDLEFPSLKDKTEVFYNVVSIVDIKNKAALGPSFEDNFDGLRILTVGRMTKEKGQDYAIKALKIIRDRGVNAKWYFIGDGNHRATCEQLAKELGISDYVYFLGTKTNPYPYMKDCDIYVQPSRHEGYCITLAEARVFGNPIVATDFVGAKEQLATRENALVTGFSESDMAEGVLQALSYNKQEIKDENVLNTDLEAFLSLI